MSDTDTSNADEPITNATDPGETTEESVELDQDIAEEVNAFAGDVSGKLEVNGAEEAEEDNSEDNEPEDTKDESADEDSEDDDEEEDIPQVTEQSQDLLEDPGEFTPGDYAFEVVIGEEKFNIKSLEDAEAVKDYIDKNPEVVTAKQLIEFMDKRSDMRTGIAQDKKEHEAKKEAFTRQDEAMKAEVQTLLTIQSEFNYLSESGEIPFVEEKYLEADWTDPKIAALPGIKERIEVLKWVGEENKRRAKAGLPATQDMIGAYNTMQLKKQRTQQADEDKLDQEKRKKKGAMIGGSAPHTQTTQTKGEIVGTGGSINDLY